MSKPRSLVRAARKNFATVAHHHPLPPAPIWDTFVYHPIGPIDTESRASPIATSSRVTLDHLLIRPSAQLPTTSTPRAIVQKAQEDFSDWTGAGEALAFATDEELVHALLLPLISRGDGAMKMGEYDWHRTLDPALAFHALRSRGSYAAFLRAVRPYVRSLYPRLRAAKVHQLFVSDLLLRHPDPVVLRDLLKFDGELVVRRSSAGNPDPGASEKLRSSLIRSMYTIIRPADRARFPLTAAVNLSICRAMVETQDWEGLERAWMDLYDTADLSPESSYHLLQLLIKLEPHRRERAMGLFSTMVTTGKSCLPMGVLSRVDDQHPQTGQLLLRSALVRACCRWKLYQRAQSAVEVLLDVAVQGASAQDSQAVTDALSLTRQVCRVSLASAQREDLDWVGGMLSRMARMKQDAQTTKSTPRVPGRLLDLYVAARASVGGKQEVRDIYTIESTTRGRLSTHSLLHIAEAGGDEATLLRIGAEMLDQSAEAIASVAAPFIRALLAPLPPAADLSEAQAGAALGMSTRVNFAQPSFTFCQHAVAVYLASALPISTADLVHIAKRLRPHKQLAQILLEEQERRLQASIDNVEQGSTYVKRAGKRIANSDRLGMAEAYLLHGLRAMARRQLAGLDFDDANLTADIVNTLLRTPEIKRDLERMLGPDGMDMGWVIPQL